MATPARQVIPLMGGHNSKQDPGVVGVNQLLKSQGVEYLVGDTRLVHKIPGRSSYGTVGAVNKVQGLVLATYDDGTTFLLAVGGQQIYYSDASNGFTGTFTAGSIPFATLKSSTTKLTAAHFNNRWFLATGENANIVVEADGSMVVHGMFAPNTGAITITTLPVGAENHYLTLNTSSHSAGAGNWFSTSAPSQDHSEDSFGSRPYAATVLHTQSETASVVYQVTVTNSFSGRVIEIQHNFGDDNNVWFGQQPADNSDPADEDRPWEARLTISIATDGGTTYSVHEALVIDKNWNGIRTSHAEVADGVTTENIRVKFQLEATSLSGLLNLTYKIYAVRLSDGSSSTTWTNTTGALFYAISEYDALRNWESALSDPAQVNNGVSYGAVRLTLPTSARSNNATHFYIYRTSNQNASLDRSEMGRVGTAKVGATYFKDTFQVFGPNEIPTDPSYEWLILDEFGVQSFYELNTPPPPMDFIGNYKGAMFGLKNRSYYQSMAGRPHQWPRLFTIERMPFKENSPLRVGHQVGEVLWIGAEAGVILLDHPIETKAGSLRLPVPRRLEGAPGCTGAYAATPLSFAGESLVAWVSNHGIYVSNLATFERITDDIDWEATVTESSLSNAVLFWREKKQQLVMVYDSDGDGVNDSFMLVHMGDGQRSPNNRPLITLDHPGKFACWTGGRIGGVWKEFTGNVASNEVYLEGGSATADASNSYNTNSDIPFDIQTGRQYFASSVDVGRAQLFHDVPSGGTTVSLTVSYVTGRDSTPTTSKDHTATTLLALSGSRSRWINFNVNESGDFMQWRFQTVGQIKFALGPVAPFVDADDPQGILEQ